MPAELVIAALDMAHARRRPARVVHHSDQGSHYTSVAFTERCRVLGVQRSMGSVGDCYDNAMAESLFATVETELVQLVGRLPLEQAEAEVFTFFEGFYKHPPAAQRARSPLARRVRAPHACTGCEQSSPSVSLPPNPLDPPRNSVQGRDAVCYYDHVHENGSTPTLGGSHGQDPR